VDELAALREGADRADRAVRQPQKRSAPKIGRNDLCPCGSGKKFKQCHGKDDDEDQATA
jgi:uncharacterized protein YecA (UPF0149 family)